MVYWRNDDAGMVKSARVTKDFLSIKITDKLVLLSNVLPKIELWMERANLTVQALQVRL